MAVFVVCVCFVAVDDCPALLAVVLHDRLLLDVVAACCCVWLCVVCCAVGLWLFFVFVV